MSADHDTPTAVDAQLARHATLTEVAALAGVSMATASKALNDRFDVSATTRSRVLEAAKSLGFTPNALARGLMVGRTHTVGILTYDLLGRFVPPIMRGVETALGSENATALLANSMGDPQREERQIGLLLSWRVDGLIVVNEFMRARPPLRGATGVPTVYVFGRSESDADMSVLPDVEHGGRLATEHLISQGRREIFHVSGPCGDYSAQRRAAGVRSALREAGLPDQGERIRFGEWSEPWGWEAVDALLARGVPVDGVVAGNDQIARGAIDRLQTRGIGVPEDVAVVGYDNWDVLTVHGRTPISSVDMRLEALGAVAVRRLYEAGPTSAGGVELVQGELIVRDSSVRH